MEGNLGRIGKTALASAALAAISLCAVSGGAYAGQATEPGVTIGYATGAQPPEGVYFLNNLSFGNDRVNPHSNLWIEDPAIYWSTPYQLLGGRVAFLGSVPSLHFNDYGNHPTALALASVPPQLGGPKVFEDNTLAEAYIRTSLSWNLGNGFHISQSLGIFAPGAFNGQTWTPEGRTALSYVKDGWNLTANVIYGFGVARADGNGEPQNGYVNIDLTATKRFDKWEVGAVGFLTFDTNVSGATFNGSCTGVISGYFNGFEGNTCSGKTERAAVGGLIGYHWGPMITRFYVTQDVYSKNNGETITTPGPITFRSQAKPADGYLETRVWTSLTVPLWVAEQPLK